MSDQTLIVAKHQAFGCIRPSRLPQPLVGSLYPSIYSQAVTVNKFPGRPTKTTANSRRSTTYPRQRKIKLQTDRARLARRLPSTNRQSSTTQLRSIDLNLQNTPTLKKSLKQSLLALTDYTVARSSKAGGDCNAHDHSQRNLIKKNYDPVFIAYYFRRINLLGS